VLFVDDDEAFLRSVRRAISRHGYQVLTASSGEEGLTALQSRGFTIDIVVSDDQMPGMAGAEFLSLVRDRHPDTVRIMLTGQPSMASAIKAINSGEVFRFLEKPCSTDMLALTIQLALQVRRLHKASYELLRQVRQDRESLDELERETRGITEVRRDSSGVIVLDSPEDNIDALTDAIQRELEILGD
jgi:DNA-binding NtrC family response regulator